jgi:hypothetical protein
MWLGPLASDVTLEGTSSLREFEPLTPQATGLLNLTHQVKYHRFFVEHRRSEVVCIGPASLRQFVLGQYLLKQALSSSRLCSQYLCDTGISNGGLYVPAPQRSSTRVKRSCASDRAASDSG